MTEAARKADPDAAVVCDTIGRTGPKIRLRARGGRDLFDDPLAVLDLLVGDVVLVANGATDDDWTEMVAAEVIGKPAPAVVELRTRAELPPTKVVTVRKSQMARVA